ncbi:MAG: transketolase [Gammaproteobacteria bacterium]|nr:transketolase [Gammaproteobacteria bacterium]
MRSAMMKALFKLANDNKNVVLITGDLGFGLFEDFSEKFPSQFINIGIAEQNMIGVASGLALEGKIVFVYSIGNFPTLRCLEQIRNDACYHNLNINIICMGAGFSYGALGMSHHATEDVAIMRSLPGTTVISPSTEDEAYFGTIELSKRNGVGYLRLDKSKAFRRKKPKIELEIGKGNILKDGTDYTIIACGGVIEEALLAADSLDNNNISCKVISMHTIKPIDNVLIQECVKNSKGIISLEEGNIAGGLGSVILEACLKNGEFPLKMKTLGINDEYVSIVGSQEYLRDTVGISKRFIVDAVLNMDKS